MVIGTRSVLPSIIKNKGGLILDNYAGDSISVIGASHLRNNAGCQDSSRYDIGDDYAIAVVSDGHGSSKHFRSGIGSSIASEVGIKSIKEFIQYEGLFDKDRDKLLRQLEGNIILKWNQEVGDHVSNFGFQDGEMEKLTDREKKSVVTNKEVAYGATFIAVVMTDTYSFGIQIGDGDCVVKNAEGRLITPIPEDDRLVFNMTTSLCDGDAIKSFRHFWIEEPVAAALVTTDGVRNSFINQKYYLDFCGKIIESYNDIEINQANEELSVFLKQLTSEGSGDDVSTSIVLHRDRLNSLFDDLSKDNISNEKDVPLENEAHTEAECENKLVLSEDEDEKNFENNTK